MTQLQSVINNLDAANIACRYAPSCMVFKLDPGTAAKASGCPNVADGAWYVRGWTIEQHGFGGGDSATFSLQSVTDSGSTPANLDVSPAITNAATMTRIDIALATLTFSQGIRVALTSGAIPASAYVTITVQVAFMLRKLSEL